jgi:hypothetical protein
MSERVRPVVTCAVAQDGFVAIAIDGVREFGSDCIVATSGYCPPRFESIISREFRFRDVLVSSSGFPPGDVLASSRDYLADCSGWLVAVEDSPWLPELQRQNETMYDRGKGRVFRPHLHFILSAHDSTFECLASGPVESDVDLVFGPCR